MAKRFEIVETPFGLCSDPNAKTAPEGSLSECSNVVKRRDGILQPRNGATPVTLTDNTLTSITRIIPVGDDALLVGPEGAVWQSAPDTLVLDLDDTAIAFFDESVRVIEVNGAYYINTTRGIRRFRNIGDEYVYEAGIRMDAYITYSRQTVGGGYLDAGNIVAYRCVLKRTDGNGNVVRSAPSPAYYLNNDSGTPAHVLITATLQYQTDKYPEDYDEDLRLEVYRTLQVANTIDPGDTMYLAGESKFVAYYDPNPPYGFLYWHVLNYNDNDKENDELGQYLYTSVSQQGLELQNIVPPAAHEMSLYNGSVFLGNCTPPPTTTFAMKTQVGDLAGESDGAGVRELTGDFTTSSDTITNVSDITGVEIGQYIFLNGYTDGGVYVESASGSSIVMDKAAVGTGATQAFDVRDTITFQIDSVKYTVTPNATTTDDQSVYRLYGAIEALDLVPIIPEHISNDTGWLLPWTSVVLEPLYPFSDSILVWATHGESYEPALAGPSLAGGVITYAEADGYSDEVRSESNYVYTSKAYQPEHFTYPNKRSVGNSLSVDRLVNLRDANLIFKRDGLFSMFGYNADSGWSTQTLNTSVKLLRPDAAVAVDDKVFAITQTGFVLIDSSGAVTDLSRYYFHNEIRDALDALLIDSSTETLGCWVAYDSKFQEVIFALPDVGDEYVSILYIYNIITRSFTTWTGNEINHIARASDTSDTSPYIAGEYHDQVSDYFWKFSEAEYCRDRIMVALQSFFLGEVEDTPMAILESNSETITTSNYVEYGGNIYDISAVDSSAGSGLVTLSMNAFPMIDHRLINTDGDQIFLAKRTDGGTYYICAIDRATLALDDYIGPISGTPYAITYDASYVYWTDSNSYVFRWDKSGSEENLFTASSTPYGCAIYGSDIYWCNYGSGKISYRPKDGTGAEADLITGLTQPRGLYIYSDTIYWTDGASPTRAIKSRLIAGGGTTTTASGLTGTNHIHVDGTSVYYYVIDGTDYIIKSSPIGGGAATQIENLGEVVITGFCGVESENDLYMVDTNEDLGSVYKVNYLDTFHKLTLDTATGLSEQQGTVDIYDPIDAVITWLPKYGPTRAFRKNFQAGSFVFTAVGDLSTYYRRLSSSVSYTSETVKDQTNRYNVPVAHARQIELEPSIKMTSAENADWELSGTTLEYTTQAPRGVNK